MTTLKQKIIIVLIIILIIQILITLYLLYDWWNSKNDLTTNNNRTSNGYINRKEKFNTTPTTSTTPTIITISHPTLGQVQNNNNSLTCGSSGSPVYFLVNNNFTVFNNINRRVTLQICDINGTTNGNNLGGYLTRDNSVNNVPTKVSLVGSISHNNSKCAWYLAIQTDGTYLIYNDADTINTNGTFLFCDTTNSLNTKYFAINKPTWNINIISGIIPAFPPVSSAIQITYNDKILKYDKNDSTNTLNSYNIRLNNGNPITNYYINNDPTITNYEHNRCAIYFIDDRYNARYILHYTNILMSFCDITQTPSALIVSLNYANIGAWYFSLQSDGKYIFYNDYGIAKYSYLNYNTNDHFMRFDTNTYNDSTSAKFSISGNITSIPQYPTSSLTIVNSSNNNQLTFDQYYGTTATGTNLIRMNGSGAQPIKFFIKNDSTVYNNINNRIALCFVDYQNKLRYMCGYDVNGLIYGSTDKAYLAKLPQLWSWFFYKQSDGTYQIYTDFISPYTTNLNPSGNFLGDLGWSGIESNFSLCFVPFGDPRRRNFTVTDPQNLIPPPVPLPTIKLSTPDYVYNVMSIVLTNNSLGIHGIFVYGKDGSQIDISNPDIGSAKNSTTWINYKAENAFNIVNFLNSNNFQKTNKYRSLTDAVDPKNVIGSSSTASGLASGAFNGLAFPAKYLIDDATGTNSYISHANFIAGSTQSWTYTFKSPVEISGIEIFTVLNGTYSRSDGIQVNLLDSTGDIDNPIAVGSFKTVSSTPQNLNNTHKVFTIGSYPDISPTPNFDSPIINVMDINTNYIITNLTRITTTQPATTTPYVPTTTTPYVPTTTTLYVPTTTTSYVPTTTTSYVPTTTTPYVPTTTPQYVPTTTTPYVPTTTPQYVPTTTTPYVPTTTTPYVPTTTIPRPTVTLIPDFTGKLDTVDYLGIQDKTKQIAAYVQSMKT
jgi:hypothetical protein